MAKIHVDIDDTIADTTSVILQYLKVKHNLLLEKSSLTFHNYLDKILKTETNRYIRDFEDGNFHNDIVPIQNSVEIISKLSKKHELIIISGRRLNLKEKTTKWVDKFFPNCFKEIHLVNQYPEEGEERGLPKHELCKNLKCDFSIEDDFNTALKIASLGIKVLLMNQPWNSIEKIENENIIRVNNWEEVYKIIEEKALE
jgi:uncharacterized HAD superfamily protein